MYRNFHDDKHTFMMISMVADKLSLHLQQEVSKDLEISFKMPVMLNQVLISYIYLFALLEVANNRQVQDNMNLQSSTLVPVMELSPYCLHSKFRFCSNQPFICTQKHQIFPNISEKSLPTLTCNIVSYLELCVHSLKDNKCYFSSVL